MEVITVQGSLGKDRQESFWYVGQVAIVETDHGTYSLEACGDIRVMFEENGEEYCNNRAVREALNRKLTDNDLNKINEFDGWIHNNWFEVVLIPKDGNDDVILGDVAYDYDDGITMLKEYASNEH